MGQFSTEANTLAHGEGPLRLHELSAEANWTKVYVEHMADKLLEMNLINAPDARGGRRISLTEKGRAYVVDNGIDMA